MRGTSPSGVEHRRLRVTTAWLILGFLALLLSLSGCQPTLDIPPRSTQPAVGANTPTPILRVPSRTLPSLPSAAPTTEIPYPPPPPTPYHRVYPYPVPTRLPPGVTVVVRQTQPPGAAGEQNSWSIPRSCGPALLAQVNSLADGSLDLKLSGEIEPSWTWTSLPESSQYQWQEIQPLIKGRLSNTLAFFGLDGDGQWSLVIVTGLCRTAQLSAILPVSDPTQAILEIYSETGVSEDVFWLLEGKTLTTYRMVDGQAIPVFTLNDAPATSFSIWGDRYFTDLNADGTPEIFIRWGDPYNPSLDQILLQEGDGYRLIGEIEPGLQFADVDGDSKGEFLRPEPRESPSQWDVYQWKGDQFEWGQAFTRLTAAQPFFPSETNLPRLPTDLYFWRDDNWWVWPNTGGAVQPLSQPPTQKGQACRDSASDHEVVSWSPDCRYAVLRVPGAVEGGHNVLLDTQTGREISIPNTFTYASGLSTFAWDPGSRYLIHARADGSEGLYRLQLPGGAVEPLMAMNIPAGTISPVNFFGAVDPYVLPGGSIGFAVEGFRDWLYPPRGVYRLDTDGGLHMLADIPPLAHDPEDLEQSYPARLHWSPDGSMFLYAAPASDEYPPSYQAILLGKADGSAVWDVTRILNGARDFQWRGTP